MKRGLVAFAATVALAASALAQGQQKVRINLANAFPNNLTLIGEAPGKLAKKLDRLSGGTLELRVNEPGALVPHGYIRCSSPPAIAYFHSASVGRNPPSQMQNAYDSYQLVHVIGSISFSPGSSVQLP